MTWPHGQEQAAIATEQQNKHNNYVHAFPWLFALAQNSLFAACLHYCAGGGTSTADGRGGQAKTRGGPRRSRGGSMLHMFLQSPQGSPDGPKIHETHSQFSRVSCVPSISQGKPRWIQFGIDSCICSDVSLIFRWKPRCPKNSRNALTYSHFARGRGCS